MKIAIALKSDIGKRLVYYFPKNENQYFDIIQEFRETKPSTQEIWLQIIGSKNAVLDEFFIEQ